MAASAMSQKVLNGYRAALRARLVAFKGDHVALKASREELRRRIEQNRSESDPAKIDKQAEQLNQLARMLRQNVVQAEQKNQHLFKARIHEEIEKTDMKHRSGDKSQTQMDGSHRKCCSSN